MKRRVLVLAPLSETSGHLSAEQLDISYWTHSLTPFGGRSGYKNSKDVFKTAVAPNRERLDTWLEDDSHWGDDGGETCTTAGSSPRQLIDGRSPEVHSKSAGASGSGQVARSHSLMMRADSSHGSDTSQSTHCDMQHTLQNDNTHDRQLRPSSCRDSGNGDEENVHAVARRSLECTSLNKDRLPPPSALKHRVRGIARFFRHSAPIK